MPPPTAPHSSSSGGVADLAGEAALALYRGLATLASPALRLVLSRRARRGKADPTRSAERSGIASYPRPVGRVAWVHAASVGETLAVIPLIARIVASGLAVVFTSGTVTSAAIAASRLPKGAVHQYPPLDVSRYVDRFLDHWRPEIAIVVESELWPATIAALARRATPLVIVNGRLSDRSFPRWRRFRAVTRPLLASVALVLAQSPEDGERFRALGARSVAVSGNLKWDAPPLAADAAELSRLRTAIGGRPVWLAASTHVGEEEAVAAAHQLLAARFPRLLTLLVPRHPQRGEEVAAVVARAGLTVARRSLVQPLTAATAIYVGDTLGELGVFYRLAPVAFIGNSLAQGGGHNPLEAIQLGAAVLSGPRVENFADVFARLAAAAPMPAIRDANDLATAVAQLLADPVAARRRAVAQAAGVGGMNGALAATLDALRPFLRPDAVP